MTSKMMNHVIMLTVMKETKLRKVQVMTTKLAKAMMTTTMVVECCYRGYRVMEIANKRLFVTTTGGDGSVLVVFFFRLFCRPRQTLGF
jgi:hypothetical protein